MAAANYSEFIENVWEVVDQIPSQQWWRHNLGNHINLQKKCLEINDIMQFIKSFETWQLTGHDVDKVDFGVTIINVLR